MTRKATQAGFSLLEAVIALGVASYALVAAYGAFSGGAANLRKSNDRIAMMLVAEEQLATLILSDLPEGVLTGATPDGYEWRRSIIPYTQDATQAGPLPLPINDEYALFDIEITVTKDGGAPVTLRTLKGRSLNDPR